MKTCVKRPKKETYLCEALDLLLQPAGKDKGALFLAEYVASRSGIPLKNAMFLEKVNLVWMTQVPREAHPKPLSVKQAILKTFCHAVTKVKVKGLIDEDALAKEAIF